MLPWTIGFWTTGLRMFADESVEPGLVDPCEMMSQRVKVPRVTRFRLGLGVVPGIFWVGRNTPCGVQVD